MKKIVKPYGKFLQRFGLPITVFITGACVLVIEIVATRILSPYFGNTIFTVSSVVSVVLAALSLGYVIGGRMADRNPSFKLFYSIIAVSGLSVLLLQVLNRELLPVISYGLPITSGPLILSMILFFLPSLLLGTLSPFAIKLQVLSFPKKGVGSIAGEIFFWSTFGSILGSLSSGFILIPRFGINSILASIGATLTVLGVLPAASFGAKKMAICVLVLATVLMSLTMPGSKSFIYQHDGTYEKITIYDGQFSGHPTRFFRQDASSSGAMFMDSNDLVYDYTKYYSLYQLFKPDTQKVLVIGGGAYSIPKVLLNELPRATVDVAEIEPSLFNLGKKYFNVPGDSRLRNHVIDGRRFLEEKNDKYDIVFSDVYYSLYSIPSHFTTSEFFRLAKSRLNTNGIFMANLIGDLSRQSPSFILSEMRTFRDAFPNSYFFAVDSPKSSGSQNIIFVGYNSDRVMNFSSQEVVGSSNEIVRNLNQHIIDPGRFELSAYPRLSDNYSPVENLTSGVLKRAFGSIDKHSRGKEMLATIAQELRYGPRYLSASGHKKIQDFIVSEMNTYTPSVKQQTWTDNSGGIENQLTNIVASFFPDNKNRIIIGTHYDSKRYANLDKRHPADPMPGANDSASGVAELINLARYLSLRTEQPPVGVDLVFFDGEEGKENISSDYGDWQPLGSTYFVNNIDSLYPETKPASGIVIDMVCDSHLILTKEQSSFDHAGGQAQKFWDIGKSIDSVAFSGSSYKQIYDDHSSLNAAGIPSFLVIDYDYPPFHTTADTLDKCSAKSLETIATTLTTYLYSYAP